MGRAARKGEKGTAMNRKTYERLIRYAEAVREPWKDKYAARRTAMILKGSTRLTRGEKAAADAAFNVARREDVVSETVAEEAMWR